MRRNCSKMSYGVPVFRFYVYSYFGSTINPKICNGLIRVTSGQGYPKFDNRSNLVYRWDCYLLLKMKDPVLCGRPQVATWKNCHVDGEGKATIDGSANHHWFESFCWYRNSFVMPCSSIPRVNATIRAPTQQIRRPIPFPNSPHMHDLLMEQGKQIFLLLRYLIFKTDK